MGSENEEIDSDDETINAEKINSTILSSKRTSVAQITNDSIFPQLSHTSTHSKSSAIPPESELIAALIFDPAKLIKQYNTKAIHSVPGTMTPIITATPKRRHEVIVSPNQENTTPQANKVSKTEAESLLEGLSIITESEGIVSFYSPSPNLSQFEGILNGNSNWSGITRQVYYGQ